MKLALLSNQWQGVVRRAQQRRGIIDSLIRQWQRYKELLEKLSRWLQDVCPPAEAEGGRVPLQQARCRLEAVQVRLDLMETCRAAAPSHLSSCLSAEGEAAAAPAGQLHPDGGGRPPAAAVSRRPGGGGAAGPAHPGAGALEGGLLPPGGPEEAAGRRAEGKPALQLADAPPTARRH